MTDLAHHLLLAIAVLALAAAGLRAAATLTAGGLEQATSAGALAAGAAAVQALALGLLGLGTDPWALTGAALVTWVVARATLPRPPRPAGKQLATWWGGLGLAERLALGALAGVGLAWTIFLIRFPAFGWDGVVYHLPEIAKWVQNGTPGSIETVLPGGPSGTTRWPTRSSWRGRPASRRATRRWWSGPRRWSCCWPRPAGWACAPWGSLPRSGPWLSASCARCPSSAPPSSTGPTPISPHSPGW